MRSLTVLALLSLWTYNVFADGNDWVNPAFVLKKAGAPGSQKRIVAFAASYTSGGPWTVSNDTSILPPDGVRQDYLSWAPYHWPNCNWCTGPRTHLSTGGNRTNSSDGSDSGSVNSGTNGSNIPEDGGGDDGTSNDGGSEDSDGGDDEDDGALPSLSLPLSLPVSQRRMIKKVRRSSMPQLLGSQQKEALSNDVAPSLPSTSVPLPIPSVLPDEGSSTTTTDNVADGTAGAENARKTQAPKDATTQSASKTTKGSSSCTPSPSKALPASATWTLCPYVVRDGQLNPDVRLLPGVNNIVDVTQSSLYNAIAAVFTDSQSYAQTVASQLQLFFLDPKNGVNPNINYGQVIRGPQKQVGQFLGVLDFRGMVKTVNAIAIMRAAKSEAWTSALDSRMNAWSKQYVNWLQTSAIGQKAASAPNNHGSFFANQAAAMNILLNDQKSATTALNAYFTHQFLDQIAASGEQPFEAVRTRPYHYRCFNLEAMITNAKLGDQLGMDFWTAKSKYGATIQNALDYTMKLNTGKEDVSDIFPHVAAVAAAYGDPTGKYNSFLKQRDPGYMTAAYYFYDQPGALTQAPVVKGGKEGGKVVDGGEQTAFEAPTQTLQDLSDPENTDLPAVSTPTIPFECPAAFATSTEVQLDDGVYVTCDELKPFYGYLKKAADSAM